MCEDVPECQEGVSESVIGDVLVGYLLSVA